MLRGGLLQSFARFAARRPPQCFNLVGVSQRFFNSLVENPVQVKWVGTEGLAGLVGAQMPFGKVGDLVQLESSRLFTINIKMINQRMNEDTQTNN